MGRVDVIKVASAVVADESGFKDINSQGASQTFVNLYKHSFSQFIFLRWELNIYIVTRFDLGKKAFYSKVEQLCVLKRLNIEILWDKQASYNCSDVHLNKKCNA